MRILVLGHGKTGQLVADGNEPLFFGPKRLSAKKPIMNGQRLAMTPSFSNSPEISLLLNPSGMTTVRAISSGPGRSTS